MKMFPSLEKKFTKEQLRVLDAQRLAHEIAFAPVIFQVSRLMEKFGIFRLLSDTKEGLTVEEVMEKAALSRYAVQVLLESSLTIGTVLYENDRFTLSKAGWILHTDPLASINLRFNHDVNYLGMYRMEEALLNGKPEGLKVFGQWKTIYEGLSSLPEDARKSWLDFDHFYSDHSFDEALGIVFSYKPATLLDVGGNTGRWALRCVGYDGKVHVTIMDLPQQIGMMKQQIAGRDGEERIHGHGADLLDRKEPFPKGFDAIWMSQFLDCFSEDEIVSILQRAAESMDENTHLFIMETLWDRQANDVAALCLTQLSLYFTVMANGNSKMYHSEDMIRCVEAGGLKVEKIYDGLRGGHAILVCRKA
ncbi:MAG: methyltransferase domain-containing protein [Tannerella sp.]|jgi:hypothetical protein|nr:methyltransferase domain-containing protein [Tannerella sp.]